MDRPSLLPIVGCCLLAAAGGCQRQPAQVAPPEVPVVPVSRPVERDVTDYVDFTGRTDAVQAVDVRARVTGYLVRIYFKEGAEVRGDDRLNGALRLFGPLTCPLGQQPLLAAAGLFPGRLQDGDLLFEIDPRPYQAQLDQAQSQVALNHASLRLAQTTLERDQAIAATTPGAVSRQQIDQDQAAVDEAAARVRAYQASTEVYRLNLSFTKVRAPIDGQISRYYYTVGNLVNQDQTLLTSIVSLEPMYVYFDMDEPTLLRLRRARNEGKLRTSGGAIQVLMGLQGEEGYPHQGALDFINNQVSPTTGSISVRGVFNNPKPPGGERLLSPGMFARVRLLLGDPHPAKLVIDRAIGSDQGLKYVYVMDADHKAQYRRVTTGPLEGDGLRVILDGLKPDDWVVVGGLPQLRPRMEVKTEQVPMPTLTGAGAGEPPTAAPEAKPPAPVTPVPGAPAAGRAGPPGPRGPGDGRRGG
jgi:multidrug efflux system membrane fusion protein